MICRRMNLSHHDSEDIVQQVFIKLWQQLPEKDVIEFRRFRSWLCAVTGNTAKDFIRSRVRRSDREVKAGAEQYSNISLPDVEAVAEEEWKRFIVAEAMLHVRRHFSDKIMEIFDALHEGRSVKAVAEKFDVPPNTVSVYKKRVLDVLCKEVRRLEKELA